MGNGFTDIKFHIYICIVYCKERGDENIKWKGYILLTSSFKKFDLSCICLPYIHIDAGNDKGKEM